MARSLQRSRLIVVLKARQLGLTWLALAFALWLLLFYPIATVLLFSRRDDEARDLLAVRLRGMYDRLPAWLKSEPFGAENDHEWQLANGSRALAFPTTAGDGYTATLAVVDEADLCPDLDRLMRAVKPTIDGGGRMVLLSRSDKSKPQSPFKRIYTAARQGRTDWAPVFLPWSARPARTQAWYDAQATDVFQRTGSLDDMHEQYPATDVEALAPRTLDKRIAPQWLHQCYREQDALAEPPPGAPSVPGLEVYALPREGRSYVIGGDPAEGNPTSDPSALTVLDRDSGEEAASLAGRFEPAVFAAHIDALGRWYNGAAVLVERNNHGHAVLLWLADHSGLWLAPGHDGRPGWLSNSKGKSLLYDAAADAFREGWTVLHSFDTFTQPSMPGKSMSRNTTSGCAARTASSAEGPSGATSTSWPCPRQERANASADAGWSSTTRTRKPRGFCMAALRRDLARAIPRGRRKWPDGRDGLCILLVQDAVDSPPQVAERRLSLPHLELRRLRRFAEQMVQVGFGVAPHLHARFQCADEVSRLLLHGGGEWFTHWASPFNR